MERDRPGATGGKIKCGTGEEKKVEKKREIRKIVLEIAKHVCSVDQKSKGMSSFPFSLMLVSQITAKHIISLSASFVLIC